jgi:ComF family protein
MQLILQALGALLAPERCSACDVRVDRRAVFCPDCARTVVKRPAKSRTDWAPFVFGGAVAHAIHHFKYGPRPELARPLGELLRRGIPPTMSDKPSLVVPVPLHPTRLAERGFNQAALLARVAARALEVRSSPRALARVRDTPRQALLDRASRRVNVNSAFEARDPRIEGSHVLLVDDVRTTGATLLACSEVLRSAGARAVTTLVLAAVDV